MKLKTCKLKLNRALCFRFQVSGNRGITLLEFLIAIGVLVILAGIIIGAFSNFRKNSDLNSAAESGISLLAEARSKTLSSQNASRYGVRFETGKIVFFKGITYSTGAPDNKEVSLSSNVEISNISLNGSGSDVVFKRLTGETDQFGTVTFRLKSDTAKTKTITVISTGVASIN